MITQNALLVLKLDTKQLLVPASFGSWLWFSVETDDNEDGSWIQLDG